ncbi:MAG: Hsp20/alpha crystallin family protein, partial [Thermoproteota archaeon]
NNAGEWEVKKIDKPDVKGYVIRGRFGPEAPNPFNPMQPQNPNERRPTPKRRFNLSQKDLEQIREPLTDVFEEEDSVTVYLEMPNENKKDIKLNIKEDKAEIKGKKCNRTVDLPTKRIDAEKASTKYKNGVFEISIPKKK